MNHQNVHSQIQVPPDVGLLQVPLGGTSPSASTDRVANLWGGVWGPSRNFHGNFGLILEPTIRDVPGKWLGNFWGALGRFRKYRAIPEGLGRSDSLKPQGDTPSLSPNSVQTFWGLHICKITRRFGKTHSLDLSSSASCQRAQTFHYKLCPPHGRDMFGGLFGFAALEQPWAFQWGDLRQLY